MKEILKEEIRRGIKSKGMIMALLIGVIISVAHIVQYQIPAHHMNLNLEFDKFPMLYPLTVADTWLGGNSFNIESFLYFLIMPIIAVLPFGTSFFADGESGFIKGLYMRVSRKQYLYSKYIATFVTGGIAVTIPLVLNLVGAVILLPNLLPPTVLTHNGICAANVFYEVYFSHPIGYIVIFLCFDFLLAGVFACTALACSFITDYKVIVVVCPFFIQLAIHVICTILGKIGYSSVYFLQSGYGLMDIWVFIAYFVLGLLITFIVFTKKGARTDILG